jgi:hypothetical protein
MVGSSECLDAETDYVDRRILIGEMDVYIERKRTAGMGKDFSRAAKKALQHVLVLTEPEFTRFRISLKTPSEFISDAQSESSTDSSLQNMVWMNTSIVAIQYEVMPSWNPQVPDERDWIHQIQKDLRFTNARLTEEFVKTMKMNGEGWNVRGINVLSSQEPFDIDVQIPSSQIGTLKLELPRDDMEASAVCANQDHDKRDANGNDCSVYRSLDTRPLCGKWDTADFKALELCCACGGGGMGWLTMTVIIVAIAIFVIGCCLHNRYNKPGRYSQQIRGRMQSRLPQQVRDRIAARQIVFLVGDRGQTMSSATMRSEAALNSNVVIELPPKTSFVVTVVDVGRRVKVRVDGTPEDAHVMAEGWISTQTEMGQTIVRKDSGLGVPSAPMQSLSSGSADVKALGTYSR